MTWNRPTTECLYFILQLEAAANQLEAADIQQKLYFILQTTMPMLANRGHLFTNVHDLMQ